MESHIEPPISDQKPHSDAPAFDWGRFARHLILVCAFVLVVGGAVLLYIGRRPLEARAQQVVGSHITEIRIDWPEMARTPAKQPAPAPTGRGPAALQAVAARPDKPRDTWLPEQFQEELSTRARRALGANPDPLSREPLVAVAQSLFESGWFAARPQVEREPEGVLRVRGQWRIPAGAVVTPAGEQLVSWDAFALPVTYRRGQSGQTLITGVVAAPPQVDGRIDPSTVWPGDDLAAALELLKVLRQEPYASQVAGIDVAGYAKHQRLTIVTAAGGRVVWGGRPGKPLLGEIPTRRKLQRLAEFSRRFKSIDAGQKAVEIFGPFLLVDETAGGTISTLDPQGAAGKPATPPRNADAPRRGP